MYGTPQLNSLCLLRDDLVDLYIEALQNSSFNGTYNATAPNPVRMSELCSSLGRVIGRPSWLPVPEFALQVLPCPCLFPWFPCGCFWCCPPGFALTLPFGLSPCSLVALWLVCPLYRALGFASGWWLRSVCHC